MANKHDIIKFRRGTAAEWTASQPQPGGEVLRLGEPGWEKDTGKLKIGDGTTPWNSLPYLQAENNEDVILTEEDVEQAIVGIVVPGSNIDVAHDDPSDTVTISFDGGAPVDNNLLVYNSATNLWEPSTNLTFDGYRMVIDCDCPLGTAGYTAIGEERNTLFSASVYSDVPPTGDADNAARPTNRFTFRTSRGTEASPTGCDVGDTMFIIRGDATNPHGTLNPFNGLLDNRTLRMLGEVSATGTYYLGSDFIINTSTGGPNLFDNELRFSHDSKLTVNNTEVSLDGHTHPAADITDFVESVQDTLSTTLLAGTGINLSYNDLADTLTISSTGVLSVNNPLNNRVLTSDGTTTGINAESNLTFNGSELSVTGDVSANFYFGAFDGPIVLDCKNNTGSTINKGTPVYISGHFANGKVYVAPADASNSAKMPAVGLLGETLTDGQEGHIYILGSLSDINTSAYTDPTDIGKVLYVASGGGLTLTRPTSESILVQNIAKIARIHGSNGRLIVLGSGRTEDVPNSIIAYKLDIDNIRIDGNTLSSTNSNGNIIINPSGTGALQRDSGGDARGQYAVDWQTSRSSNAMVAAGNYSVIGGGTNNTSSGHYSAVGGGYNNEITTSSSTIGGGRNNDITGAGSTYGTIGGGYGNVISSLNAIGTTIAGGGVNNISSSYANYCTIGGGNNNYISGNYATHTTICGGSSNTISGNYSDYSTICGGSLNDIGNSAYNSTIGGGSSNYIGDGAIFSVIPGGSLAKTTRYGELSHSAGNFNYAGDAQHTILVARKTTIDATANEVLFLDESSARLTIPEETTWTFSIKLSAYNDTNNEGAWWIFRGGIRRNAANGTALIGSLITESGTESSLSTASASVVADDTNDALEIRVTGVASKDIRWVAVIDISQVSYGTP